MCSGSGPAHGTSRRRVAKKEAPAITNVRGIPCVVRYRRSTVVRAEPLERGILARIRMTKVTPFLTFNDQLEAAIAFYTGEMMRSPNGNARS